MAKKKGPPYVDDPECQYVVVEAPWPDDKAGSGRDRRFFNMVAVWLSYMTNPRIWPEELYYVSTRADVIVKYPQDVDISPIFGEHQWRDFLTISHPQSANKRSYVFPFNYRRLGHPAEHNWTTHIPDGDPPPRWGAPPFHFPWPAPLYAEHFQKSCTSLALPMPRPAEKQEEKPATPPPAEDADLPAHYALAHHLPDDPPPQDEVPPQEEAELKPEPLQAPPQRLFVSKLDPYDEEDTAALFLKAEPLPIVLPEVKIEAKVEEYEPSADLINTIRQYEDMLQQEQDAMQTNGAAVKAEPGVTANYVKPEPNAEAYQASAQLIAAIEAHEAQLARERAQVKAEEEPAWLATNTQQSAASARPEYTVKQEYASESLPSRPLSSSSLKRVKQEHTDPELVYRNKRSRH